MSNIARPPRNEGVTLSAPQVGDARARQDVGPWVLAATILASSMVFIDGAVVNLALPALQADIGATVSDVQWVIEAYTLFLAALLLVGGSLGDQFGRRRVFSLGIVLFTLASVWCGFASNPGQLIAARAVQGVGGALLVPGSLAIISAYFNAERRGRAIGTWSGATSITTALGPVLGGFLIEHASWRWVFFINVPLAVAVLALCYWRVPESRDVSMGGRRLDWPGALFVTTGLGLLVYGLIESSNRGLGNPLVLGAIVVGAVALALFLIVEARTRSPMMPLSLFRSRTFSGANLLTLLLYGALSGMFFFLPFNLIQVHGYSTTAAGASFLPFILLLSVLSRWSGGLITRYGSKLPLVLGPAISAIGFILFAVPGVGGSYWTTFFPAILVLGVGMAVTVAPLTTTVMGAVDSSHSGLASGINNAVSRTAGLLAIAALGIVVFAAFNSSLDSHLASISLSPQVRQAFDAQRIKLAGAEIPNGVSNDTRIVLKNTLNESYVAAFRLAMFICAGLAASSALIAFAMIDGKQAASPTVPS